MTKPKLLIVSTFDELCGIAGYTRALLPQLDDIFECEVFDLDQYFMRGTDPKLVKIADAQIDALCQRLDQFDAVNIQLEHGTLGHRPRDIARRFEKIAAAAPRLSVTFHTILQDQFREHLASLLKKGWRAAPGILSLLASARREYYLNHRILKAIRDKQQANASAVITHTKRDARNIEYVNGIKNVFHHPLVFHRSSDIEKIKNANYRDDFPMLRGLPQGAKIIGLFGFLSPYKGFEVALKALRHLPDDWHIALFGGLHPNEIRKGVKINAYIATLLKEIRGGETFLGNVAADNIKIDLSLQNMDNLFVNPQDMASRVYFVGSLSDQQFANAMLLCDCTVFPYEEVGQSASGPVSIAIEMGVRIIASRTRAFMQLERYFPGRIEFFEIGNHVELAQRILSEPKHEGKFAPPQWTAATNADIYARANGLAVSM
ncbi:MAG: hypothetical protein KGQ37_04535 [Hyphomicrobiales bacterium]|nr:hypothetical protein [Hyphomicrobiales bacterium]